MKGLLLDNLYKSIRSMKLLGILVLIAGIALLISGNGTFMEIFVYISITALSATAVSSMRKDIDVSWNKYELTLPVTRNMIINSRYICYLLWVVVGVVIAALFTILSVVAHGNVFFAYGFRDVISLFSLGVGIAVTVGTLYYPFAYLFGADRSEALLLISAIGSVGLVVVLVWIVNNVFGTDTGHYYLRLTVFVSAYILLYIVSYLATRKIFNGKEVY